MHQTRNGVLGIFNIITKLFSILHLAKKDLPNGESVKTSTTNIYQLMIY